MSGYFFESYNPIFDITDNGLVYLKNGSIAMGCELVLPQIFTIKKEDYGLFFETYRKIYRNAPVNTLIHRQDMYFMERGIDGGDQAHFLTRDYFNSLMSSRRFLKNHSYIYFILLPEASSAVKNYGSGFFDKLNGFLGLGAKGKVTDKEQKKRAASQEKRIKEFLVFVKEASLLLNEVYKPLFGGSRILGVSDYLGDEANNFQGLFHKYATFNDKMQSSLEACEDEQSDSYVIRNGKGFLSSVCIDDLTMFMGTGVHPLKNHKTYNIPLNMTASLGLPFLCEHINNFYIYKPDQLEALQVLDKRAKTGELLSNLGSLKRLNRETVEHIDGLKQLAVDLEDDIVYCQFNTIFLSEDYRSFELNKDRLVGILSDLGVRTRNIFSQVDLLQLFWAGYPCNGAVLKSYNFFDINLQGALCFLPNEGSTLVHQDKYGTNLLKLTDRLFGVPVALDLDTEPKAEGIIDNFNVAIFGPSGSGKSLLVNVMLYYALLANNQVVIFDKGGSYTNLVELFNGKYYSYSSREDFSFNPFYIENYDPDDLSFINYIMVLVMALFFDERKEEDFDSKINVRFFDRIIRDYYKTHFLGEPLLATDTKVEELNFDSFYYFFLSRLEVEKDDELRHNFRQFRSVMQTFCKNEGGTYGNLLNAKADKSLDDERLIVFETDGLKDNKELYGLVSLIVTNLYVRKLFRNKDVSDLSYVYIVFEEAWDTLGDPKYHSFYKWMMKTSRKHRGKPIIVTQELGDLFTESNKEIGRTIISNCDTIILLDLTAYRSQIEVVREILSIDDGEFQLLKSLNADIGNSGGLNGKRLYKELWIKQKKAPANVYANEISPMMYWAFNTDKQNKSLLNLLRKCFQSLSLAEALMLISRVPPSVLELLFKELKSGNGGDIILQEGLKLIRDYGFLEAEQNGSHYGIK